MFDCWHHHRGGGLPEEILAVPGERFFAMQLNDALVEPMEDVMEETLNHRRLPGEGCIDLVQTLRNLKTVGAEVIYDIEVFSDPMRSLGAAERARQMFEAARVVTSKITEADRIGG